MTDWLGALAAYLQSQGLGVIGADLFWGQLPVDLQPETLVTVLVPTAGKASDRQSGGGGGVDFPRVQITCRCSVFASAWSQSQAIYYLLDGRRALTLGDPFAGGTAFGYIKAVQAPFLIGQDDRQAWRVVANYQLEILRDPASHDAAA